MWPLHRLRPQHARAMAGRPIWAKAPQRRSNERRGQLFRTCARAAGPDFLRQPSAAAGRFQRARVEAQRPTPAHLVKISLQGPECTSCGGPTSGPSSSRTIRQTFFHILTIAQKAQRGAMHPGPEWVETTQEAAAGPRVAESARGRPGPNGMGGWWRSWDEANNTQSHGRGPGRAGACGQVARPQAAPKSG